MIFTSIKSLFDKVELTTIDHMQQVELSELYRVIISTFPNLQEIMLAGKNKNQQEFSRTVKHIFRSIKVYFLISENKFFHKTLSPEALLQLSRKLKIIESENSNLVPLIIIYHDIGRFIRKRDHPFQSYKLVSQKQLLEPYALSMIDELLIKKVIQYHLLIATIFTGESTFLGTLSLLNDPEIESLLSHNLYRELFIDILEMFTFIDILGYSYAQIFDHYLKYYLEINNILKIILKNWNNKKKASTYAFEISKVWLDWRIAGALRIFQFVGTEPYLTTTFYYNVIKSSIVITKNNLIRNLDWENIVKKYLFETCKVQIKYGLGFLMILAFGKFSRARLKPDTSISCHLILFWILLSKEMKRRANGNNKILKWNVYILGVKNWFGLSLEQISKIKEDLLQNVIENGTHEFDGEKKEYNFYIDFSLLLK